MQKSTLISASLVGLILIAGIVVWAYLRGTIYFENGLPRISVESITNPAPVLNRGFTYPEGFSDEAKTAYEKNRSEIIDTLTADSGDYEAWMDLAIYYRMVNDHDGAVEVWKYLQKKYPEAAVVPHNLGNYYFYNAKDYETAEKYYRESIAANAGFQPNYVNLHDMYRLVYKTDTSAAENILKEGIVAVVTTDRIDLKIMLGRYYRDVKNDTENARKYLTEARDNALDLGDRDIANELNREIQAL